MNETLGYTKNYTISIDLISMANLVSAKPKNIHNLNRIWKENMENVYKSVKTFKCSSNLRFKHNLRWTGTQNGEKQNRTDKELVVESQKWLALLMLRLKFIVLILQTSVLQMKQNVRQNYLRSSLGGRGGCKVIIIDEKHTTKTHKISSEKCSQPHFVVRMCISLLGMTARFSSLNLLPSKIHFD